VVKGSDGITTRRFSNKTLNTGAPGPLVRGIARPAGVEPATPGLEEQWRVSEPAFIAATCDATHATYPRDLSGFRFPEDEWQPELQVPRRQRRRRVGVSGSRPPAASAINHAQDVVFDTCANGQTLKWLTIVDEWTRECLAIHVDGGIRSGRVIAFLKQLVSVHGAAQPPLG